MKNVLYLAWRYLAYHRIKTCVLVAALAIIIYLPFGLNVVLSQSAGELTSRARSTPLLIGDKGSRLELVLNSLYFESTTPNPTRFRQADRVNQTGYAAGIPLHTRFRAGPGHRGDWYPVVGTTLEYFEFRHLRVARGRQITTIGECVLGALSAEAAGADPAGYVVSRSEGVFDFAGTYPLKMKVVGVLQPTGTPDDRAVFVDIRTAWVIEGLGHGHDDLTRPEAADGILRKSGNRIIANRSVVEYNEITPDNLKSFHFHGDPADFPITSVLAVPHDTRSGDLLQGRYLADDEPVQVVRPGAEMNRLLETVFTVQGYVLVGAVVLGVATLATMVLVFLLSLQLRRREIETMEKIGGSRARIVSVLAIEVLGVLVAGMLLAGVLTAMTSWWAASATRWIIRLS